MDWLGVAALSFGVEFLLLLGADRLSGGGGRPGRLTLGAALGAVYTALCLLPGLGRLASPPWRIFSLWLMGNLAYGIGGKGLKKGLVFAFLWMAVSAMALCLQSGSFWAMAVAAVCLAAGCFLGAGDGRLVWVELCHGGRRVRLKALRDTGNLLRDPVTGKPVLVVGPQVAKTLVGLSPGQLEDPVGALGAVPGLRLIPYRCIGSDQGLLLALGVAKVRIGPWRGSGVVAFAPRGFDEADEYQGLTGGIL